MSKKLNKFSSTKSIKGPRSALTDFIREEGINIDDINKMSYIKIDELIKNIEDPKNTDLINNKSINEELIKEKPKKKKIRTYKPFEIINRYNFFHSLEYKAFQKILSKLEDPTFSKNITDKQLEIISECLSLTRNVNEKTYNFLASNFNKKFVCKDCSNLKNLGSITSNKLEYLELRLCGQITSAEINSLIKRQKKLKTLIFTGCFGAEDLQIPLRIKHLDLSKSSRLNTNFLKKLKHLDYLNISFCNSFDENFILNCQVKRIECEETFISDQFFKNIDLSKIFHLNLKNCLNISKNFDFNSFENIEILEVEGISTIKNLKLPQTLKKLNIKNCFGLTDFLFLKNLTNLEDLNISNLELTKEDFENILKLKNLKRLNISWNGEVDDEFVGSLCKLEFIEEINVFGCFKLTEKVAEYAWTNGRIEITGNPAETKFLLN